ncbi:hypothetical protein PB2503_11529 [Parvularcula bermudensis HTCC2503]|uniref:2-oxo-4-hydroxy-4-carboxy-5-ureidoimidazoline decarboxylase n=1 Tax=Parvularcula bermudensis (strain ATCC BAA-594 / HTCC2503 / KCTC 12087) TaxID=314260 RepID=E0TCW8_PARBH|nr:2-oxo-4-hydroxy-4-carboxy-5-ureidoimidazoline decarboxylase [Parvularcula bermudensis]ADM10351.1 hypothetical protein PB2503_11529 [Parvularcula bermudensis HTCC2503]
MPLKPLPLDQINEMAEADYVAALGFLFEHSPWVVERSAAHRPFATTEAMMSAFGTVLETASREEVLGLLNAHPDLAGKAARAGKLTAHSTKEQAAAGLNSLTEDEYDRFHYWNRAYHDKYGIPFIICVRNHDRAAILAAMETRSQSHRTVDEEVSTALDEVLAIVRHRLKEVVHDPSR